MALRVVQGVCAAALVVAYTLISALTACLNESPTYVEGLRSNVPWLIGWAAVLTSDPESRLCQPTNPAMLLGLAGGIYLLFLSLLHRFGGSLRLIWAAALCSYLIVALGPGLLSTDVLDYASHGRVLAIHGANPYAVPHNRFPGDLLGAMGAWGTAVTVYGPLWTDLESLLAALFRAGDPVQMVFVYRAIALVSVVGSLLLIQHLVTDPHQRPVSLGLFALNPLVVVEGVSSAHNESLILLLMLAAMALVGRFRWLPALAVLAAAALVKFVPAAMGAVVTLAWLKTLPNAATRIRTVGKLALVCLALAVVVSLPYLGSTDVLRPVFDVAAGGQRYKNAWQDAVAALLDVKLLPLIGVSPDAPIAERESISRAFAWGPTRVLFLAYAFWEAWNVWRARATSVQSISAATTRFLLLGLLLVSTQVLPWYFLWPLASAAVLGWRPWESIAAATFAVVFLAAYYLREFQPYGVFYLPLYLAVSIGIAGLLKVTQLCGPPTSRS